MSILDNIMNSEELCGEKECSLYFVLGILRHCFFALLCQSILSEIRLLHFSGKIYLGFGQFGNNIRTMHCCQMILHVYLSERTTTFS